MKKRFILLTLVLLIVLGFIFLKNISFGTKYYNISNNKNLYILKNSFFVSNQCDGYWENYYNGEVYGDEKKLCINKIKFKTFLSKKSIKRNLQNLVKKYEEKTCRNKTTYTDSNLTIIDFGIEETGLLNTYYISYIDGNININDCNIVDDYKNIEYKYDYSYIPKEKILEPEYKYMANNGKLYEVYTDYSDGLLIKNGSGEYHSLPTMLKFNYMDMDTLIKALDYQAEQNIVTKVEYENGTFYKNNVFSLFQCSINTGNKNIYISDNLEYSEDFCK